MIELYKKIKNIIAKHDLIFIFIIMALGTAIYGLNAEFEIKDELWNFSNIYKIYNGLTLYKDTNVIQTPIFFLIGNLFFKLFGANYLVFKVYNIAIYTIILVLTYILFRKLNVSKRISIIGTFCEFFCIKGIVAAGANYNTICILFILIGTIIQIDAKEGIKKYILQGVVIFSTFFSKQNIGVYYMFGIIIYTIIEMYKNKKYKQNIKNIIIEFGTAFILLLMSLFAMYRMECLEDFINYCVLGLAEFSQNLKIENFEIAINTILQIIFFIMITIIYRISKPVEDTKRKKENFLLIIGICCYLIEYPIINEFHYILAKYIAGIYLVYIVQVFFADVSIKFNKEKLVNVAILVPTILIILISVVQIVKYENKIKDENKNIFYGIEMSEEQKKDIDLICNYIQQQHKKGTDVKILSYKAMVYMTPLKINNKDFDLPFLGNLGYNGENRLIEQIKNLKNTKILITENEQDKIYQESNRARQYIIDNMELEGTIGDFIIYKNI